MTRGPPRFTVHLVEVPQDAAQGVGGGTYAASVFFSLFSGGEKRRSASSNDASDAASAAADASAAASTALRSIWLGITRGDGWGAFTSSLGPLWGVTTGSSSEEGDHASGTRGEGGRSRSPDEPRRPSARSTDRRRSTGDATPARAHAASTRRICSADLLGVTRECAGERDPPVLFSLPLGEGVCEEEEPKATRDFSGVARVEEARRGAPESSGAPTTEETRRDASSSSDRRGRAGDRRSVLGDVRARIFEGARRGMRPPRVVFRTNYRSHFFSDVFWAVSAEFVCFFPPFGAGENRVQSGRCRPSFLGRDFGCHPGISFRFHLETHVHAGDLSGRSTAVGWRLEPTRSRRVAAPHH